MALTAEWSDPVTGIDADGFASLTKFQAAQANEFILQNIMYVKARPIVMVSDLDGTVSNTTSTSWADITGATVDITTSGDSKLRIDANIVFSQTASSISYFTVLVDGTNQGNATYGTAHHQNASVIENSSFTFLTAALSDGSHTVKLQYKVNSSTTTVRGFNLVVQEVG